MLRDNFAQTAHSLQLFVAATSHKPHGDTEV